MQPIPVAVKLIVMSKTLKTEISESASKSFYVDENGVEWFYCGYCLGWFRVDGEDDHEERLTDEV